ncbi:HSP70/90 co-chaperone [Marasmius crinis-equi]|uniref:HSP70/90 co-chaperone n=1 Tax=Marasmius crinis-equi TaxID=585013 RepID=A0ABR3FZX5_9AGAR
MSDDPAGPETFSKEALEGKLDEFDNVPLFMKSLPEDAGTNPTLAALQELAYEGTPDEVADNFRERGNESYKEKKYRDALMFYNQGIEAKPTDLVLKEKLLLNIAACNLILKNFGSVLRDCASAITINSKSLKAYYRSSQALLELDRLDEAIDCCKRSLAIQEDKDTRGLLEKAEKKKAEKEEKEKAKLLQQQKEKLMKFGIRQALQKRNVIVKTNPNAQHPDQYPHFDPEDPTYQSLIFPVYLEYPEHGTYDVVPEFVEDTPFSAHLDVMFPPKGEAPAWDKKGEYTSGKLVVYASTKRKRLLKVGRNMSLRDLCDAAKAKDGDPADGLELTDGHLTFAVVPKGDYEKKWIEDFKRLRAAET